MSSNPVTRKTIISSLFWKAFERIGKKGITFVISIILARLLAPRDYGIVVLVMVFIDIAVIFIENGFSVALVQKKNADDTDFSSVFFFSIAFSAVTYIILWFAAPFIAGFYKLPEIKPVLRVLSAVIFLGTLNSIQHAILSRNMAFKKSFKIVISGVIVSAFVGIWMAYAGFGVWALVGQKITSYTCQNLIMWYLIKWKPKLLFSLTRLKSLFSFGGRTFLASMLHYVYNDFCSLIIGKSFSSAALGIYNKGITFPQFIVSNLDGPIQSVMFPALASFQEDEAKLKKMVRRAIVTSSFLVIPAMAGLAVVAEPLVVLLLTEKWLPCVFFLQWACIKFAFWPMQSTNLQVLKAMGHGKILFRIELAKKIIMIAGFCIAAFVFRSLEAVVIFDAFTTLISILIGALPNRKLIGYSLREQLADVIPFIGLSALMGLIIMNIRIPGLGHLPLMLIQAAAGIVVYFAMAWILRLECLQYLINIVRKKGKKD